MSCPGLCGKKLGLYSGENGKPLKVSELREDKLRFEDHRGKLRKRVHWREEGLETGTRQEAFIPQESEPKLGQWEQNNIPFPATKGMLASNSPEGAPL